MGEGIGLLDDARAAIAKRLTARPNVHGYCMATHPRNGVVPGGQHARRADPRWAQSCGKPNNYINRIADCLGSISSRG